MYHIWTTGTGLWKYNIYNVAQKTVPMMFIIMEPGTVIWNSTDVHFFGRQSLKANLWAKCWLCGYALNKHAWKNINMSYGECPTENEPAINAYNWYSVIGEGACAYPQQGRRLKGQVPLETSRQPIGGQQKSVRSRGSGSPWQRHTRAVKEGENIWLSCKNCENNTPQCYSMLLWSRQHPSNSAP